MTSTPVVSRSNTPTTLIHSGRLEERERLGPPRAPCRSRYAPRSDIGRREALRGAARRSGPRRLDGCPSRNPVRSSLLDAIPVERREVEVVGGTTAYWVYGPEDAETTVVAVHGFRGEHHGLEPVVAHLPDVRVISPDLPGVRRDAAAAGPHGTTSRPTPTGCADFAARRRAGRGHPRATRSARSSSRPPSPAASRRRG